MQQNLAREKNAISSKRDATNKNSTLGKRGTSGKLDTTSKRDTTSKYNATGKNGAMSKRDATNKNGSTNKRDAPGKHDTPSGNDACPNEEICNYANSDTCKNCGLKKNARINSAEIIVGLGQACQQAWVFMLFYSMGLYANSASAEATLDLVYLLSIIVVCTTLFASGYKQVATENFLENKVSIWLLPAGMSASTMLAFLSTMVAGAGGLACQIAAGILTGIFSGLFLVRFGLAFSRMRTKSNIVASTTGTICATLLFAISCLFGAFETSIFAASMPIAAAFFLSYGMKELERTKNAESAQDFLLASREERKKLEQEAQTSPDFPDLNWTSLIKKLMIAAALFGFASEIARTFCVQMSAVGNGGDWYALMTGVAGAIATMVTIALALVLVRKREEADVRNCYRILVFMLLISYLVLPTPLIFGQAGGLIAQAANSSAYACFGMLMWVVLTGICSQRPAFRVRTFAYVRAAWAFGPLTGMACGRVLLHNTTISFETLLLVMALSIIAVFFASNFAFNEADVVHAMDLLPTQNKRRFREKCARLAQAKKLSEREFEVMVLLAKGRNLPFIQEELLLSKSTVSTHRQHIYQKLDIHSQQELINMVQEVEV